MKSMISRIRQVDNNESYRPKIFDMIQKEIHLLFSIVSQLS